MQVGLRSSRAAGKIGLLGKVADPVGQAIGPNPARKTNSATEKMPSTSRRKIICAQRVDLPACEPAQFVRFAIGDPQLAQVPAQTLAYCLQQLWRSTLQRCGSRQNACR